MKKFFVLIAMTLIVSFVLCISIGEQTRSGNIDINDLQNKVQVAENMLMNAQDQLERHSIVYNLLVPCVASNELSMEEKDKKILEVCMTLEEQAKTGGYLEVVPEDLKDFLMGEMTWQKIKDLSVKMISEKEKAEKLKEYEITVYDFRTKDLEATEMVKSIIAGLSDDQVTQLRLDMLDAYYEISTLKEKIKDREERLEKAKAELEEAEAYENRVRTADDYVGVWMLTKCRDLSTGEEMDDPDLASTLILSNGSYAYIDLTQYGYKNYYSGAWVVNQGKLTVNLVGGITLEGNLKGDTLVITSSVAEIEYVRKADEPDVEETVVEDAPAQDPIIGAWYIMLDYAQGPDMPEAASKSYMLYIMFFEENGNISGASIEASKPNVITANAAVIGKWANNGGVYTVSIVGLGESNPKIIEERLVIKMTDGISYSMRRLEWSSWYNDLIATPIV